MNTTEAALRDALEKAEREYERARNAMDNSTYNGRNRTDEALAEVKRLRAALSQPSPASSTAGAKVEAYNQMREIAEELGYPSILEALEATPPASSGEPASVAEQGNVNLSHEAAIKALCDCAATVTVLSYQEVIEGYFSLRGLPIPGGVA